MHTHHAHAHAHAHARARARAHAHAHALRRTVTRGNILTRSAWILRVPTGRVQQQIHTRGNFLHKRGN